MALHTSLTSAPGNMHELHLRGRISNPHWLVFLLSGLAESGISLVSGRAQQTALDWNARLLLDFSGARVSPQSLDYAMLAEHRPVSAATLAPQLTQFDIARRPDGSLEVRVQGPDQIGFLGRFLGRLSLVMLFPVEIEIRTVMGQIHDRVVLRGIGGTAPDEAASGALKTFLHSFCIGPRV